MTSLKERLRSGYLPLMRVEGGCYLPLEINGWRGVGGGVDEEVINNAIIFYNRQIR